MTYFTSYLFKFEELKADDNDDFTIGDIDNDNLNIRENTYHYKMDTLDKSDKKELIDFLKRNFNLVSLRGDYADIKNGRIIDILDRLTPSIKVNYCGSDARMTLIFEKVIDKNGNEYGKELITGLLFPIFTSVKGYAYRLVNEAGKTVSIKKTVKFYLPYDMESINNVLVKPTVADKNEVEEYIHRFDRGLFKEKRKNDFISSVTYYYNQNIYGENFKLVDKAEIKEKESQNIETKLMENIEFLIQKISLTDKDLYETYKLKYENILSGEFDYKSLAMLEGELEFHLLLNKRNAKTIDEYLDRLKLESMEEILEDKKMNEVLTLDKIDSLESTFLKTKDQYSLLSQRNTLRNLAFIYFIYVYKNINSLSKEELQNSYFVDNLKSIMIVIKSLSNLNIIENNISIELGVNDINLDNVLDIIKNIKFINNKDNLKLIKDI